MSLHGENEKGAQQVRAVDLIRLLSRLPQPSKDKDNLDEGWGIDWWTRTVQTQFMDVEGEFAFG